MEAIRHMNITKPAWATAVVRYYATNVNCLMVCLMFWFCMRRQVEKDKFIYTIVRA